METIPLYVSSVFAGTTILTMYFFYKASNRSSNFILLALSWVATQIILSLIGFYQLTDTLPPRFLILIGPPVLTIALLFLSRGGRTFLDSLDLKYLTLLHMVRLPVELVLFWLYQEKAVPELMTFEGRNFDIFSGLSAPFILYFHFLRKWWSSRLLLTWNIACLLLLLNIVIHAILSAPSPFQQIAFEQPNIAVLYFPFTFLPGVIVPIVLFSHLASIWKILVFSRQQKTQDVPRFEAVA